MVAGPFHHPSYQCLPSKILAVLRDRSFFMREGGLVGLGGGPLEKNWLKRGGQPKKNEGKGGGRTKKLD